MIQKIKKVTFFAVLCLAGAHVCWANDALPSPPVTEVFAPVLVQGLGNPATASYAKLLRGAKAFADNHALAPLAPLRFRVVDVKKSDVPTKLRLEAGDTIIPITLDDQGLFELPAVDVVGSADGELVTNRKAGEVMVGPYIASPGTTRESQRLGDLRLWCEVSWAIEGDDAPMMVKMLNSVTSGTCKSAKIRIFLIQHTGGKQPQQKSWRVFERSPLLFGRSREHYSLPLQT